MAQPPAAASGEERFAGEMGCRAIRGNTPLHLFYSSVTYRMLVFRIEIRLSLVSTWPVRIIISSMDSTCSLSKR